MAKQPAQIRELINYIDFLEAKVSYLQYHHERCGAWGARPLAGANAPYLPPDTVIASDEASYDTNDAGGTHQATLSPAAIVQPSKRRIESNPRWKQIVDQITKGWDKPSSWIDKRKAIGLDSVNQNRYALTAILGLKKDLPLYLTGDQSAPSVSLDGAEAADALISSARQYALDTQTSQKNSGLVTQVHLFRELVFVSLCVVMEHQTLPIDTIDSLMRICISSSGSANLYRLRRGALWVNRVISGTMVKKLGWGRGSTEFFFLCRNPYFIF